MGAHTPLHLHISGSSKYVKCVPFPFKKTPEKAEIFAYLINPGILYSQPAV